MKTTMGVSCFPTATTGLNTRQIFNLKRDKLRKDDIYTQDEDGDTLLHVAIILQETHLIMFCILNAPSQTFLSLGNSLHQTPLHLATLTNQPEVVRRLVTAGAELQAQDKNGNTALHLACRDGYIEIANNLLEPVKYQETIENSYQLPYQQIPQDMGVLNYDGLSCLHLAVLNGHFNIVKNLIASDVDINAKDGKTGRSILHYACLSGDITLTRFLLRYKSCDINARTYDGSAPFDLARARGHEDICVALAAAGAQEGMHCLDQD